MKYHLKHIVLLVCMLLWGKTASAQVSGFVEDEENLFRLTIQRQLAAPKEDLVDRENPDKKTIRFVLSVYGEYFGSSGILASIDYSMYLREQNLQESEEFRLVQSRIRAWGRKSALTISANLEHFSGLNKDEAVEVAKGIEGERWELLQKEAVYMKTASFWNETSSLKKADGGARPGLSIAKVMMRADGALNVGVHGEVSINARAGRATITSGQIANCDTSFYTDLSAGDISSARFSGAIAIDNGFGKKVMAWRDDPEMGVVQVIRGRKQAEGVELFVLKISGFERPLFGNAVRSLSDDDLSVLALRGTVAVDDHARKVDYNSPVSFLRFGSRLDARRIQEILDSKNGDIRDLEPFLVIYADRLLELPDEERYENYNKILRQLKQ